MLIEGRSGQHIFHGQNHTGEAERWASHLYRRFCNQDLLSRVWLALTGRSRHLLDLTAVQATNTIRAHRYIGVQTVPISQIRGSSSIGRSQDFDADFRPLKPHTKARWLSVATARRQGVKLPPVELIQVGQVYFVEDGHHRVSVARALGEQEIEAEVTICCVAESLVGENPAVVSV